MGTQQILAKFCTVFRPKTPTRVARRVIVGDEVAGCSARLLQES